MAQKFPNTLQNAGNMATEALTTTSQSLQDVAGAVAHEVKDVANKSSEYISDAASNLDRTATSAVGSGLNAAGEAIRRNGPQQGSLGQAASMMGNRLTEAGEYVNREGVGSILNDVANAIRTNSLAVFLIGVGVGCTLMSARTRRS